MLPPARRVHELQRCRTHRPPSTQFVDGGWSTLARILPFMEGGNSFNALNFNIYEYNDAIGINFTGASTVVNVYICPSATRSPDGGRDGVDPNDRRISASRPAAMATMTTARPSTPISIPTGNWRPTRPTPATPFRNKFDRANGLLKQGKTRIAEITDGTSNTIAIGEDAGRDPRYLSPYIRMFTRYGDSVYAATHPYLAAGQPNDPGPAGGEALYRRYWRWAEPDEASGFPARPTTSIAPTTRRVAWPTTGSVRRSGHQRGQQRRTASFHPGGVNCPVWRRQRPLPQGFR